MASSPELNDSSAEDDSSTRKSSSKKKEGLVIGAAALESAASTAAPERRTAPESLSALWEKIVAKPAETAQVSKKTDEQTPKAEGASDKQSEAAEDEAVPLDSLSESEARTVANADILEREQTATDERASLESNTPEAAAAEAALAYASSVREQLESEDSVAAAEAIQAGYEQTLGEIAPDTTGAYEAGSSAPISGDQNEFGPLPDEFMDYEEPDDAASASYAAANGATGGGSGFAGGANFYNTSGGGSASSAGVGAERVASEDDGYTSADIRRATGGALVVGGIIGYLIGRRQGRLKTERQLLPVQKKLETEVRNLHNQIAVREAHIRKVAFERAQIERRPEATAVRPMFAEQQTRQTAERAAAVPRSAELRPSVENMRLEEVLNAAEKIVTGSTTVRKIYETNLISERGLRRIVNEHWRGGDVQRVLTEELLVKELGHELDPILRDRPLSTTTQALPAAPQVASHAEAEAHVIQPNVATNIPNVSTPITQPARPHPRSALLVANMIALTVLAVLLIVLLFVWLMR